MIRISASKIITTLVLCLCCEISHAADNLYVFVFKNGIAQQDITINVGKQQKATDEFGLANFVLPADVYEIGYYKNGELFALTEINLIEDQQSQVFLELTQDGVNVDLDLPLAAYNKNFEQQQIREPQGPQGTLKLRLLDSKDDTPIAGVRLFFKGYAVEATSDGKGVATVELSEGLYDISIIHPKYAMRVLKDMSIKADVINEQDSKLVRADIVMQDYVVTAPAVEGSLASTFTEMKESSVIGEALSSEEFTKSGDSSASDALKRVTGITVVDGKYIYVRGLGERYSVVMLNDLHLPSPEPTKRVVPLDIFPSSIIQSMTIQKTYSTDLPGTFAGGDVLILSKDIPEEDNYAKLSLNTTYNESTGKEVVYNGDNRQGLPADIIKKSANFQELQEKFGNGPGYTKAELQAMNSAIASYRSYNLQTTTLKPGQKIAIDFGQSFKTSGGIKYGFVGTAYTVKEADSKDATKYSPVFNGVLLQGARSDYQQTTLRDKLGGLVSVGVDNQTGDKIKYTYLGIDDKEDSSILSEKDDGALGPGQDDQKRTHLEYNEKTITAHQLRGDHNLNFASIETDLFNDINISWALEKAKATRFEPGTVDYYYEKTSDFTDFTLNKKIWFLYSDLVDELDNNRVDITLPYKYNTRDNFLSFGFFDYHKSRTLDNRRLKVEHALGTDVFGDIDSVFNQENVDSGDLVLTSNYRSDDAYTAKQDTTAFYIKQLVSISKDLDMLAGIRQESSKQQLIDTKSGVPYDPLITDDNLVSLSLNYSFNSENKIRLGYANTLSRPDFREFSPNRYTDPITEDLVYGYPNLKYTTIQNLDLKYEWYISYDEIFSVGLFFKDFVNPVETIKIPDEDSQRGKKKISYRNALGATTKGVEMSIRKKFGFLGNAFSNYFISSNFALIDSKIRIERVDGDVFLKNLTTLNRPMQGQSPYVVNINIGYDNLNTGRSAILLFNEYGKRISALGTFGAPDYYEYPFKKLDFVVKWRLNDTYDEQVKKMAYNLNFKLTNILNSSQESREGDMTEESYKPGSTISLSFSMKY